MNNQTLKFETLSETTAFQSLEEGWESLCHELSSSITVFGSFIWYQNWWKFYSSGSTLHLYTMWQGDKLLGIAPLMQKKITFHGLTVRTIGFIQNNESLHNDFIVKPELRDIFLQNLFQSLFKQSSIWDVLYFRNICVVSDTYKTFTDILKKNGRNWNFKSTPYDTPYIVPSGSWPDYFAKRSRRTRKTLKNIKNKVQKSGDVSVKNIRTREEFLAHKEEIFKAAKQSWTENVGGSLGSRNNREFYESLALKAAEKGWLSIWLLFLNSRIIALEFHLRAYGKEHALRGHYDSEYASISPGTFLEMTILEHVFKEQEKLQIYDLCGAFDDYKKKWTDTYVPHNDIFIFNEHIYSRYIMFHEFKLTPFIRNTLQGLKLLD